MARAKDGEKFETKFYEFEVVHYDSPSWEFPKTYSKIYSKPKGTPASRWTQLTPDTTDTHELDALGQRILGII